MAILFFIFLLLFYVISLGCLDPIVNYRGESGFSKGGTTFGIGLVGKNRSGIFFALFVCVSSSAFWSFILIVLKVFWFFLSESVFFIIFFAYVIKNHRLLSPFLTYLMVFFLIYSTVWLIGNDNLGTAVRLRVFSYLSIYICAAVIFFQKRYLLFSYYRS